MTEKPAARALSFNEHTIRADDLVAECDRLHVDDLARLSAQTATFVEVPCPACGSPTRESLWSRDGFEFVLCGECATGYVCPRPTSSVLDDHYRASQSHVFWAEKIYPASEAARREHIAKPRVARVLEICKAQGLAPGGTLFEVGAGFGTFCEEARTTAYFDRIVAIEPTPSNADACRKRGVEVLEVQIEHAGLAAASADVVASFEVIEHLFDPLEFVSNCREVLKPNGILVLSCPNLRGFEIETLGKLSPSVDPEHLNYFHPDSMRRLLGRAGLDVIEVLTPGQLDADIVRKRAAAGMIDLASQPFLQTILGRDWERLGAAFQRFLVESALSSHMWTVARKRV